MPPEVLAKCNSDRSDDAGADAINLVLDVNINDNFKESNAAELDDKKDQISNPKLADEAKCSSRDLATCPSASKFVANVAESDEELIQTPESIPPRINLSSRRRASPVRVKEPADKYRYSPW